MGLAEYLANHLALPESKAAVAALAECPPSLQNEALERCLRHGVAFHHAELDEHQRSLIENGFRQGEIRILSSTSTLASGVNLPAKNVFIESVKYAGIRSSHTRELVAPLTGVDFHQAAGRAGRLGCEKSFGRAIMTASTPYEHEILWDKYIYGQSEDPLPGLSLDQLPELLLHAISCGAAGKPDEAEMVCRQTYASSLDALDIDLRGRVNDVLLYLDKGGLITIKSWGKIEATKFGLAAGATGLSVKSTIDIWEWLVSKNTPSPLECLLLATRLGEWKSEVTGYYLPNVSPEMLIMRIEEILRADEPDIYANLLSALQEYHDLKLKPSLAAFLFALEWSTGKSTRELEATFQKGAGGLKRDSSTLCWLLRAFERIARSIGPAVVGDNEAISGLELLMEQLHFGVPKYMLPLSKAIGLDREFIRRLYENGIISPDHLYQTSIGTLNSILPPSAVKLIEKWRDKFITSYQPNVVSVKPKDARLKFTGNTSKLKNEVIIDGHSVYLEERLFNYLQKLWWGFIDNKPWVHKDIFDAGPNQAKYISRLRRILRENNISIEILSDGRGSYALEMGDDSHVG